MWVTTLSAVALISMLAVLGFVVAMTSRLERGLASLLRDHTERLTKMERELDRVRQMLDRYQDATPTRPMPRREPSEKRLAA